MEITIRESHRGLSRSSEYHFVIEGNRLIHISRFSISQKRDYDMVKYVVDLSRLSGKRVVEISSSNSGIFCWAYVYPAKDLALEYSQRRKEKVPLSFLNSFELTHLTYREKRFLQTDWKQYYVPMIEELRRLFATLKNLNRESPYVFLTRLIKCQIESQANYPLSFLIPYSGNARRKSLEGLTKGIHQLWITAHILAELGKAGKLRNINLDFEQSSYYAIASFNCRDGLCSLWYEFDMNPFTMCEGMLWYRGASATLRYFYQRVESVLHGKRLRRTPLRPDIAILQGGASCNDLVEGFKVRMIIECKNWDYGYWAKDIDIQVVPYKEIFQPDIMVLASLKKVSKYVKEYLGRYGIVVVDEVYPGGRGIDELLSLVRML